MNKLLALLSALFVVLLSATTVNEDLFSLPDFGCSKLTKLIRKYNEKQFVPPSNILDDAFTIDDGDQVYWLPKEKDHMLFDVIDLEDVLVPVISAKHPVYENFFTYALLAQYIIPSWLEELDLSIRDQSLIRMLAPFITARLRKYFQHVIWAVYFQTGQVSRGSSELMSTLNHHMADLGFNVKDLPMLVLNTAHYKKKAGKAPFKSVLAVAKHWDMNLQVISKAMRYRPEKEDADLMADQDSCPTCFEVLQSILPKGAKLKRSNLEANDEQLVIRLPRAAVDAIVLRNLEDIEMTPEPVKKVETRGRKRKAGTSSRPSDESSDAKRQCVERAPVVPHVTPVPTGIDNLLASHSPPTLEEAMIFSEFIHRVHYQNFLLINQVNQVIYHHPSQHLTPATSSMYLKFRLQQRKNK